MVYLRLQLKTSRASCSFLCKKWLFFTWCMKLCCLVILTLMTLWSTRAGLYTVFMTYTVSTDAPVPHDSLQNVLIKCSIFTCTMSSHILVMLLSFMWNLIPSRFLITCFSVPISEGKRSLKPAFCDYHYLPGIGGPAFDHYIRLGGFTGIWITAAKWHCICSSIFDVHRYVGALLLMNGLTHWQ